MSHEVVGTIRYTSGVEPTVQPRPMSLHRHGVTTKRSRRRLAMPFRCVRALQDHARLPSSLTDSAALVFATGNGTELDAHNVRRSFRRVVAAAGMSAGDWTPRELRHSFVSLLSDSGVPLEHISRLVGHSGTAVTEAVYRQQLRPVLEHAARVMDEIFPVDDVS